MSDTQTTKLAPMPYHSGALPTPPLCEANHDFPPVATRDDGLTLVAEVRRLRRRLKSKFCGCGWCCSTVPPGMAGEAHLRTCAAQKVTQ